MCHTHFADKRAHVFELTYFNVRTSKFSIRHEMNSYEFALFYEKEHLVKYRACVIQFRFSIQTYKSWRVVVSNCLGIAKGLQDGIRLNNLIFQVSFFVAIFVLIGTNSGKVRNDLFCIFRFSGTRFSAISKSTYMNLRLASEIGTYFENVYLRD